MRLPGDVSDDCMGTDVHVGSAASFGNCSTITSQLTKSSLIDDTIESLQMQQFLPIGSLVLVINGKHTAKIGTILKMTAKK